MEFLQSQFESSGALGEEYGQLMRLYSESLFHELTEQLLALAGDARFHTEGRLLELFTHIVQRTAPSLNSVAVVRLAAAAAGQMDTPDDAVALFVAQLQRPDLRKSSVAVLLALLHLTRFVLAKAEATPDPELPEASADGPGGADGPGDEDALGAFTAQLPDFAPELLLGERHDAAAVRDGTQSLLIVAGPGPSGGPGAPGGGPEVSGPAATINGSGPGLAEAADGAEPAEPARPADPLDDLPVVVEPDAFDRAAKYRSVRALLDLADQRYAQSHSPPPFLVAAYHRTHAEYARVTGAAEAQFRHLVAYLQQVPTATPSRDLLHVCTLAGRAALLGPAVVDVGLLQTPLVRRVLAGTPDAAVLALLAAFTTGSPSGYARALETHAETLRTHPVLSGVLSAEARATVARKQQLLVVLHEAFALPGDRRLSLARLGRALGISTADSTVAVEAVCIRVLASGLLKGRIVHAAGTDAAGGACSACEAYLEVTWTQPRALTSEQLATLSTRLTQWTGQTEQLARMLEAASPQGVLE